MSAPSVLKQVLRYAQTSGIFVEGAARIASEHFLGHDTDHAAYAHALTKALGNLKGPVMKIAQFLATVPGALPPEYAESFIALQTNAPPMHSGFVRRRMQQELGPHWQEAFESFDLTPRFAASLGQVHHAQLKGGGEVACKLQYPDMETLVEADLNQLKLALSVYEVFHKALKTQGIFDEIQEKLLEELDYEHEAKWVGVYAQIFKESPHIVVPHVHHEASTKRLLTMTWLEGKAVLSFKDAPLEVRNHIAKQLFLSWYKPFYHFGVIHGDPHPGNYHVNTEGGLNLLDFGCVRAFSASFVMAVIDLYRSFQTDDQNLRLKAYQSWGFEKLTPEVMDVMDDWARMLMEPLLDNRVRPIQEHIKGWDVASSIHQKLHTLGGIRPPREFVFMDRAAVGIGSVLYHLGAELNWHNLFEELIQDVTFEGLQKAKACL